MKKYTDVINNIYTCATSFEDLGFKVTSSNKYSFLAEKVSQLDAVNEIKITVSFKHPILSILEGTGISEMKLDEIFVPKDETKKIAAEERKKQDYAKRIYQNSMQKHEHHPLSWSGIIATKIGKYKPQQLLMTEEEQTIIFEKFPLIKELHDAFKAQSLFEHNVMLAGDNAIDNIIIQYKERGEELSEAEASWKPEFNQLVAKEFPNLKNDRKKIKHDIDNVSNKIWELKLMVDKSYDFDGDVNNQYIAIRKNKNKPPKI